MLIWQLWVQQHTAARLRKMCWFFSSNPGELLIFAACLFHSLSMRTTQPAIPVLASSVAARRQAAASLGKMAAQPPTAMCALNVLANFTQFYCLSFTNSGDILSGHCGGWWVSEMFVNFEILDLNISFPHLELGVWSFCWNRLQLVEILACDWFNLTQNTWKWNLQRISNWAPSILVTYIFINEYLWFFR